MSIIKNTVRFWNPRPNVDDLLPDFHALIDRLKGAAIRAADNADAYHTTARYAIENARKAEDEFRRANTLTDKLSLLVQV